LATDELAEFSGSDANLNPRTVATFFFFDGHGVPFIRQGLRDDFDEVPGPTHEASFSVFAASDIFAAVTFSSCLANRVLTVSLGRAPLSSQ
jgi:hypothetical protein